MAVNDPLPAPVFEVRHRWTFVEMLLSSMASLAASLVLKLAEWRRYADGWRLTLAGLSLHYRKSYGGRFS